MIIRHIIVFARSDADRDRLNAFIEENENDYSFIRSYTRAGNGFNLDSIGRVYSCATEKAQFRLQLMFDSKVYVI